MTAAARMVAPTERDSEDRLVAILEAVGAPISRAQIYSRVSDDFADESDLAKTLGRLVAHGRLMRTSRARHGGGEEFCYSAPGKSRTEVIAVAPAKLREPDSETKGPREGDTSPRALSPAALPTAPSAEESPATATRRQGRGRHPRPDPIPQETQMPKTHAAGKTRQKFVDYLTPARGWMSPAAIAKSVETTSATASYHLNALAAQGELQVHGVSQLRRFAAKGVAMPEDQVKGSKRETPKKSAPRREPSSPNLAEIGAPEKPALPVPARTSTGITDDPKCAIEDTGLLAINDGATTIRLGRKGIRKVVDFLTLTQHVWKGGAA